MARHKFKKLTNYCNTLLIHQSIAPLLYMAVDHQQIIPYLIRACPSFARPMKRFIRRTNTKLVYVVLGEFARHLIQLYKNNDLNEFQDVADAIEILYIRGTDYSKEALTGGLLETIKFHCINDNIDPEQFAKFLKPLSIRHWKSMDQS